MLPFSRAHNIHCAQWWNICKVLKTSQLSDLSFISSSSTSQSYRKKDEGTRKVELKTNNNNAGVITDSEIKKSVFISQSNDIFTNLALEDWLYKYFDFKRHHVLLLWVNDPCVVIGRHQNPFNEANVSKLVDKGIILARRNSGGGTVYHDRGNLNCTFFTPRERYNRKYNLNILTRAFFREWAIKAEINDRDDIIINEKKISGTAAKLGHSNAYHHCTLLVSTDKLHLREALVKDDVNYISQATTSVRSPVGNLCDMNRNVNVSQLLSAVGYEFLRTSATQLVDGGSTQTMEQRGFQLVNPTEKWFPGIKTIRQKFSSCEWVFGKTPRFIVEKDVTLKTGNEKQIVIKLNVAVEKGLMSEITIILPSGERLPVVSQLQNKPFSEKSMKEVLRALKLVSTDNVKQAINCL